MEARAKWLADLCKEHGLRRLVEIGVHRGHFSRWLLESNPQLHVTGVDPYAPYAENTTDRTQDREEAFANYCRFPGRCILWLLPSVEAARLVTGPEVVYIDGAHDTASVEADCEAWWERLPKGGILCGHDFNHEPVAVGVELFATRHALRISTFSAIESEGIYRTNWYIVKD